MEEIWVPIHHNPMYEVSNFGAVRNTRSGRMIVQSISGAGNRVIGIRTPDGDNKLLMVARLVAEYFVPKVYDLPESAIEAWELDPELFDTVVHKDIDRGNNHWSNLRWRSRSFAIMYRKEQREWAVARDLPVADPETGIVYHDSYEAGKDRCLLPSEIRRSAYHAFQYRYQPSVPPYRVWPTASTFVWVRD